MATLIMKHYIFIPCPSINQSKRIYIAPYVTRESKAFLVVLVKLSVPMQVIHWKESSAKESIIYLKHSHSVPVLHVFGLSVLVRFSSFKNVGSCAMYSLFGPCLGVVNFAFMLQEFGKHWTTEYVNYITR